MSDEIKRSVVLASVLKPVDDTRMLEKLGATLAKEGLTPYIIGYPSDAPIDIPGITFLPLPPFKRTSLKRLLIPWVIFKRINRIKPSIIITNTPELLLIMILNKMFFRRRLVYDVLENYYRTIRYTETYPRVLRLLLASTVRLMEIISAPFIDRFLLAEKGYADELSFIRKPVVLENKLPKSLVKNFPSSRPPYYKLLFSGTLATTTGVFEAIRLTKDLHAINPDYTLTIIGYAALPEVLIKIRKEIADAPFITLIGGDKLVPHAQILQQISQSGTGIIIYPINPGTQSSIPTKLYEYLAFKLPVILAHTEASVELVRSSHAGIILNPGTSAAVLHEQLAHSTFTFDYDDRIFWESEAEKLVTALGL